MEMLVGLTIIALATGVAGIALSGRHTQESAATFVQDLHHLSLRAHLDAMTTGTPRTILFDLEARTVRYVERDGIQAIPDGFEITMLTGLELIAEQGRVPVIFYGEGGSTGVEVTVKDTRGDVARLRTNWLTGRTTVLDNAED